MYSRHGWEHTSWKNDYSQETINDRKNLSFTSSLGYGNSYNIINYNLGAGVSHKRSEGVATTDYGVGGGATTGMNRLLKYNPSPKLTSDTNFSMRAGTSAGKSKAGAVQKQFEYSFSLTENAVATHLKHAQITATAGTSYYKDTGSLPFGGSLSVDSVGFERWGAHGEYSFSRSFPLNGKGGASTHAYRAGLHWQIIHTLRFMGSLEHSYTKAEDDQSSEDKRSSAEGSLFWKPSSRSNATLRGRTVVTEKEKSHTVSGSYTTAVLLRGNLTVNASSSWQEPEGNYSKNLVTTYRWSFRQVTFDASYSHSITGIKADSGAEVTNDMLMFRVTRTFGRAIRM